MDLDRILTSAPVNRTAHAVVSQRRAAQTVGDLTREELIELLARLQRKHRLLKRVLLITSPAQHRNLMYAMAHNRPGPGVGKARLVGNRRAALEYKRVGEEMQRLQARIAQLRAEAKAARKAAL